jgi:putative OPT family oligopeptide transporter
VAELDHWGLWSNYIRYIGAGAVAFGGVFSLIQSLPFIVSSFSGALKHYRSIGSGGAAPRTDLDLPLRIIVIIIVVTVLGLGLTPLIPVGLFGALLVAVFGFFFATVAARVVGLVGASNSPVSGMTIATLIVTAFLFKLTGHDGAPGMVATIAVGSVICTIAAIAGDTSQDLKTGYLLGATPRKQQIGEIIGVAASALVVASILILLNSAWGFGSSELPAPQATLMKLVVEGVMGENLPWPLVFSGMAAGIAVAVLRLPVLPVAIGLYLPIHLSVPMVIGGLLRCAAEGCGKRGNGEGVERGILFASGLIAGEGLTGILLAAFAAAGVSLALGAGPVGGRIAACVAFALLGLFLLKIACPKRRGR